MKKGIGSNEAPHIKYMREEKKKDIREQKFVLIIMLSFIVSPLIM